MYSLTIHFGPNAMCWAFLYKEKEKAEAAFVASYEAIETGASVKFGDDFGQLVVVTQISGSLLEDLDLVEEARIQRSLYNARGEVKARQRASTDSVIRTAQGGAPILTPMGGFRQ